MQKKSKQLTVGELIKILKKMPQDMLTETEGCDCIEGCGGAQIEKFGNREVVVLQRQWYLKDEGD